MTVHTKTTLVTLASLLCVLACAGVEPPSTTGPEPPAPQEAPVKPSRAPQPNSFCEDWYGAALPLEGGVFVYCSAAAVTIHHASGLPSDLQGRYADRLVHAGWTRQADDHGDVKLTRDEERVDIVAYIAEGSTEPDIILNYR